MPIRMNDPDLSVLTSLDTMYLFRKTAVEGFWIGSALGGPIFYAVVASRLGAQRVFLNNVMQATTVGAIIGSAGGVFVEYVRTSFSGSQDKATARLREAINDPHHTLRLKSAAINGLVGAAIFTVYGTFWRKGQFIPMLAGGACLGSSFGALKYTMFPKDVKSLPTLAYPREQPPK